MNSRIFAIMNRSGLTNLQSKTQFLETFFLNKISSRSVHNGKYSKNDLYSRISPIDNPNIDIVHELNRWVKERKNVEAADLHRIIRDLRQQRNFSQALEVHEWMWRRRVCSFTSREHAVQLDLIGRARGLDSAESYFNSLSDEEKTEKTYGALLNCYAKLCLTDKCRKHLLILRKNLPDWQLKELHKMLQILEHNGRNLREHDTNIWRLLTHTGRYSKNGGNLYSRISPLGDPNVSLVPELDKWVEEKKKVKVAELQRIIRDLRKRKRYSHALQVSEWMGGKGVCSFTSSEHAVQLDLIGRTRGLDSAESYFNSLSDEDKTEKTYGALLNCYVKSCLTDKSLSLMQKMKDMGFASSALCYNDLMCLYTNTEEYEKVPELLKEMKENGVTPDNFSYRICINSYGAQSKIEEMEKVLTEMICQPNITMDWNTYATVANFYIKSGNKDKAAANLKLSEEKLTSIDGLGYNHLISLYASLRDKAEMTRLWELKKSACKKYINIDYITMLSSLVRLDDLEEAEKLLKEWESSGNSYDFRVPNVLLIAYSKKGLVEKAEELLTCITEKGKTPIPNSWGILAGGYANKCEMENALRCMKMAFSVSKGVWKPNPKTITSILQWLGDEGKVDDAEAFVESLKAFGPMDKNMYHALIKANVRAGKDVKDLLESMKADKIDEDEDIQKILSLKQDVSE
ncbi:Pentatricopeptide repeat-containing protein [Thalictrum thalictroides]|uniref:Pentatricopeptide repeat-containing protein n=1 Tax=Thalictrum thalictroides TaxID=46969 RepID=A0A7J6V9I9_THATH|nr:Pentatricopeptide repeat-containing protein [Thalictrum thalictroides]